MSQTNSDNQEVEMKEGRKEVEMNLKPAAVDELAKRYIRELLRETGEQGDDEIRQTAQKLYGLLLKVAKRGKDEVKTPLRAWRDEVIRCEITSEMSSRNRLVEMLFKVYDELESLFTEGMGKADEKESAAVIFEEFRGRFGRLVIGETWEEAPRLRLIALKRLYMYKTKQAKAGTVSTRITREGTEGRAVTRKLSRRLSTALSDIKVGTWEDTFEELHKAPSTKIFPLLKLLLIEVGPGAVPENQGKEERSTVTNGKPQAPNVDELLDLRTSIECPATPETTQSPPAQLSHSTIAPNVPPREEQWKTRPAMQDPWKATFTLAVPDEAALSSAFGRPQQPRADPAYASFTSANSAGSVQSLQSLNSLGSLRSPQPVRTVSGGSDFNPFNLVDSPYLGKKKPFNDTTFSDLCPSELGAQ